jgi:hypothetical protein
MSIEGRLSEIGNQLGIGFNVSRTILVFCFLIVVDGTVRN